MKLIDIGIALMAVVPECYHIEALKKTDKFIIWAEDGQARASYSDDKMVSQVITGTVDYFTKEEFDPNFNRIQSALNDLDISWHLNSIQHEDDTGYTHYEWVFEMGQGVGECQS